MSERRQVTGLLANSVLSYVRRALGEAAVGRVTALASDRQNAAELSRPGVWTSRNDVIAIAEAAAEVCGDPDIGRRAGEELMRLSEENGFSHFVRATGSVEAALVQATNGGTKASTGRLFELGDHADGWAQIIASYVNVNDAHPFFCGVGAGYYGRVPSLFGAIGVIAEPECQMRGDDKCRYELTWSTPASDAAVDGTTADVEDSKFQVERFVARFEQMQSVATDLAEAEDVDTVLARIASQAGVAVNAPKYILAVRAHGEHRSQIHHRGFEPTQAEGFAERLLAGNFNPDSRTVVAEVASSRGRYGALAAIFPRGASATDVDRRLLAGYARHAAAALESAESLETARRDRDTAGALLGLARELAEVSTTAEIAHRVAQAVPAVARCEAASVWLWNAEDRRLTFAGSSTSTGVPSGIRPATLAHDDIRDLIDLIDDPRPVIATPEALPPAIRTILDSQGLACGAVVPITARGTVFGIVTATFADRTAVKRVEAGELELFDRLAGLADHAASAMENARLLEALRVQARHDALTALPNRVLIEDRGTQAILRARRNDQRVSVLFIDLDRFKNVNDTLGHSMGDELIRHVADRLGGCLRASDTLGRLGGDEFVVLVTDSDDPEAATTVANRVIAGLREPFMIEGRRMYISGSVGIASYPDHGDDFATLMQHADAAMYRAKKAGRGVYAVHECGRSPDADADALELEADLHLAIERGELRVLYQPQIDVQTMQISGVEALVRWEHPTLGRISPDRFIPLAEESGLIVDIDAWVREQALAQSRAWLDSGLPPVRMAVNLSTRSLRDPGLASDVAALIEQLALDPSTVELEVTDRVVMDGDELGVILDQLVATGVRLAIDDFGTGTSVLGRLRRCPVNTLKIDRSFIQEIGSATEDAPVVVALLAMAASLGMEVVAEGVETAVQSAYLGAHGCTLVQGFFFSPPVEADAVADLMRRAAPRSRQAASALERLPLWSLS